MKAIKIIAALIGSLYIMGCGTVKAPYKPAEIGHVRTAEATKDVTLTIESSSTEAHIGDLVTFEYTVRNEGAEIVQFPKNPNIRFHFIYSNGRRDNYLQEFDRTRSYRADELVALQPGETIRGTFDVKTYYFPKKGVTEFSAKLHAPRNTNPRLGKVWHGEVRSNAYGILVKPADKKSKGLAGLLAGRSKAGTPSS